MREIKFRAWDGERMYWPYSLHFNNIGNVAYCINPNMDEIRRPILMQYTGLKDKNGVEIYEGDIIYYKYAMQGGIQCNAQHVIEWDEQFACFNGYRNGCEVIGNIHQHPELLGE